MAALRTLTFCLLLVAPLAHANWPEWRGPDSNLLAPAGDYPIEFAPEKNCLWQVDLGGEGGSTPVVWNDMVFLTLTEESQDVVVSYDLDGKERWRVKLGPATDSKHRSAVGSIPSPVTNGKELVVYFQSGLVACLDLDGKELWRINMHERYGPSTLWWDLGTSPTLTSAGVCIAVIQADDSYLVTLDLKDGKEVWRTPREYECPEESDQAYNTPSVIELGGRETIVTFGADHLTGHDAKTGELLWEHDGFNPQAQRAWRVICSPAVTKDVAIVPYGRGTFAAAVDLEGESAKPTRRWNVATTGGDVPSPVIANGKVYLLSDKGELTCLDLESGNVLAEGKLPRHRDRYFSSPLLAGGNLYYLRRDGTLFVVDPNDEFKVLAKNELGDSSVSTPVPVDGTLLVRTQTKLFRFGKTEVSARARNSDFFDLLDRFAKGEVVDPATVANCEIEWSLPSTSVPLEIHWLDPFEDPSSFTRHGFGQQGLHLIAD